mgnify:CR=1
MPRSEAQKRADKKYNTKYAAEHLRAIGLKVPIAEKELYQQQAQQYNLALATYIRKCCKYCIDNNIDLSDD